MSTKTKTLPLLLLLGVMLIGVGYFYHEPLLAPNQTFMGGGHDGLKNYYTPWYHAKYDSSYTHFQGMNHPFGDHVVFADAQPLLSNLVKLLGLGDWMVGIMNYALILSIFVSAWLLYRILRRWEVDAVWAALSAAAVALLSPQLIRMNGHYALAYTFVVPLIWHLVLRFMERKTLARSLAVAVPVFVTGWLHPYFVMISAVFLAAFWAFHCLLAWRQSSLVQKILHFGLQVVFPVALFTLSLKLTDPVTDRPANPYGIDQYTANWACVVVPAALPPLKKAIPASLNTHVPENWEGLAYIGLAAILVFIGFWTWTMARLGSATLGRKLRGFKLLPTDGISAETRHLVTVSVLAGLAIGIFSFGFPFAIKPERLTELFPPIKQFRSLGRFIWAFYYTWVTFTFFMIWRMIAWFRKRNLGKVGLIIAGVAMAWSLFEAGALNEGVRIRIWVVRLMTAYKLGEPGMIPGMEASPWMASIHPEKYSALIVLPYFHEGSENFRANPGKVCKYGFEASIRTGLPLLNVMMSRTSLSQTWNFLQLATEANVPLELLDHLRDPRPILAMRFGKSPEFDGPYLQPTDKVVYAQDSVQFYEIDLRATQALLLSQVDTLPDTLFDTPVDQLKSTLPDSGIIWLDFDTERDAEGYRSTSAKTVILKDNNLLHEGPLKFAAGETIVVSLWLKMRGDRLPLTQLGFEEANSSGNVTWDYLSLHNNIKRMEGEWALCEREFLVKDPHDTFRLNVTTWKRLPRDIKIDNLLIRRKGNDVYRFENGKPVWKNNRYMQLATRPAAMPAPAGEQ